MKILKKLMAMMTKKSQTTTLTTNKQAIQGFNLDVLPFTDDKDFRVISIQLKGDDGAYPGQSIYGVFNKITGHNEMVFAQLSAAVISMQTAQQTLDRVRTGEANGIVDWSKQGHI